MSMIENITDSVVNILTAQQYRGVGVAWITKNLRGGESCGAIVDMLNRTFKQSHTSVQSFVAKRAQVLRMLERESKSIDGAFTIFDTDLSHHFVGVPPSKLPVVLLYKGNKNLLDAGQTNVAVIGTQTPAVDSLDFERDVVRHFVARGACIVSGLAYGCDAVAHRAALEKGGDTIAILPSPISSVIPAGNRDLADEIVARGGLLLTEYCNMPETRYDLNGRYTDRDRLQAMFSQTVVLASAFERNVAGHASGSRLAMRYAKEYGRLRAVVYDETIHAERKDYGLNREILASDNAVIAIDNKNRDAAIDKIIAHSQQINIIKPEQLSFRW